MCNRKPHMPNPENNCDMEKLETSQSHGESRSIKFGQQVNITERVPLGTPPQAIVMSFAHNDVTNLFISSYRGVLLSNLGSKSNYVIDVDRTLLH